MVDILERIKQLRDERGWSNYKLAKESNISPNVLNTLFRRNNMPAMVTIESLCKGLGITLSQFFAEGNEAVELTDEQRELFDRWSTLDQDQRTALLELIKKM